MMRKDAEPKRAPSTWLQYNVQVDELTFADAELKPDVRAEARVVCPKCNSFRLVLNRLLQTGHCEGCYWSFKLHGNSESGQGVVDLKESGATLALWREKGLPPALGSGVGNLDKIYKPRRGEITVVTGYPGDGKSTFLKWYLIQAAMRHFWKFLVFSPEDMPFHLFLGQMAVKIVGKPFGEMDPRDLRMASQWASNHFMMLDPPEATAEGIMGQIKSYALGQDGQTGTGSLSGINGIVIDPWTEIEHSIPAGMREDMYINATLSKFRRLARFLHVHLWIVVHPKSIDKVHDGGGKKKAPVPHLSDCAGGAMWQNKPDWGLTIHRPHKGSETEDYIVDVHVQKARFSGFLGGGLGCERMIYDMQTTTYQDSIDPADGRPWPLQEWKNQMNSGGMMRGYFDNPGWTWPPRNPAALRPVDWRGQADGGWWHANGRFEAFIDPSGTTGAWLASVRLTADATSRRVAGPFARHDDAFSWAEKMLMDWDMLPDPRAQKRE